MSLLKKELKLQEFLGSSDIYVEKSSSFLPIFKEYPSFKAYLVKIRRKGKYNPQ
ncbi:MAG: hypothetical protein ACFFCY_12575 [Promethearchaeota archaeon]